MKNIIRRVSSRYILMVTIACLYFLVYFGFSVRQLLPVGFKIIFPISVTLIFLLFTIMTVKVANKLNMQNLIKNLLPILFISVNFFTLYYLSSSDRQAEITNYVTVNEKDLKQIIKEYNDNHHDSSVDSALSHMKIGRLYRKDDEYHFGLYVFCGYGYRVLYSEKSEMKKPESVGASPVMKWFRIKEN